MIVEQHSKEEAIGKVFPAIDKITGKIWAAKVLQYYESENSIEE